MSSVRIVSGILVKCDDEVLLCKRGPKQTLPNIWSIPGGHVHKNEPPKTAAIREFYEETNLKIDDIRLIGFINTNGEKDMLFYVFLNERENKILPDLENAKDGHEHVGCKYFSLKNLPIEDDKDQLKKIIKKVLTK
jgi:8-oxo-dGTP diphosphatase